ncbi:MAG: hypothetical protein IPO65_07015 [Saprospiraceae bacterium]|nr:hypothetical protein [Saprospiraceae bacterium]
MSLLLFLYACKQDESKATNHKDNGGSTTEAYEKSSVNEDSTYPSTERIEFFMDSTNIGNKGKSKVELILHRVYNDHFVIIKFYVKETIGKTAGRWLLSDMYYYEGSSMDGLTPIIKDFNNDGYNDITYRSRDAARGGNEVQRLFVYNVENDVLISIVNSEDYPNIEYNKKLDCIEGETYTGSVSTQYLRIVRDSLKLIGEIDYTDDDSMIIKYIQNGKVVEYTAKGDDDLKRRLKEFRPQKTYTAAELKMLED